MIIVRYHYMRIWIYVNIWVFNNLLKTLLKTMLKVLNCWKNCWKIVENFLLYTETILILYRYQNDIKMISHYNACYSATNSSLWKVNRWFIRLDLPWHFGNVQKTKCQKVRMYALFKHFGNIWGYIYILSSIGSLPDATMSPSSQFTPKSNPPNHLLSLSNRIPLKFPPQPTYSPHSKTRTTPINTRFLPNYLPTK